jgi:protein gp37
MAANTSIEWTEQTWNPTTGCSKISEGCKNCYAERMALRLKGIGVKSYENGFKLQLQPDRLVQPLNRAKPTIYFVNSMSDLFHGNVPDDYIEKVFNVMQKAHWHTFPILTKRAKRMATFLKNNKIPDNIWIGVTVENRSKGVPRIDHLRSIKACIRFISIEPLLEDLGFIDLTNINWVIVGGESGPKARPMKPEWVINIREICRNNKIPFFFKQWGGWGPDGIKRSKKANGRLLLGKVWDERPQFCHSEMAA